MEETKVVNTEATATPVQETPKEATPEQVKPSETPTPSGEVVKEAPVKESTDKVPYSRFSEVIAQKNEALRRAEQAEQRWKEFETKFKVPVQEESDPFAGLPQEEREQTEKFIEKFVEPKLMKKFAPFFQEIQNEKLNKQVDEAKEFSNRVGINFDERLPEVVDFLSRPENKGRLTAKEALLSLYGDEILEKTSLKARDQISQETKELNEKKRLANTQIPNVNPNVVIHSDEMARKQMSSQERMNWDIKRAYDLAQQGVKNPKVRVE